MEDKIRSYSADQALVAERRHHIIRYSTRLLCKRGFDKATVREIAKACDMSIGSLYHYVGTKEDILALILQRGVSEMADAVEESVESLANVSPTEALRQQMRMLIEKSNEITDITVFLYQETKNLDKAGRKAIYESEARTQGAIEKLLVRGIEAGEFEMGSVPLMAHNIVVIGEAWAFRRWALTGICTLHEYIEQETEFVLRSIRK